MENKEYTLLVVDDVAENRDMLSRRLKRKGFEVRTAAGGEEALAVVRDEAIDLVLLDIMMPGVDGIEVLRRLRETYNQNELPVIMQTAKADSDDVVESLELGANDYVTKPIDFPVVLARVTTQLRGKVQAQPKEAGEPGMGDLKPGVVLAGRYRLGEPIGEGNFGAVYRAQHMELAVDVAVKVLQKNVTSGESLERFRREGVSACRIKHPNAVAVTDFGVNDAGVAYLVMELLEGTSLSDEVKLCGALSPYRVNEIVQPICDVLAEAHAAGIVHRDIKPENVFLHQTARGEVVKVLDFGIAKLAGDTVTKESLTAEGFILGTPAYMAPERLRGEPYDGRSDVYSLGIMLFYMLCGRLPFIARDGDPMSLLMMHLHEEMPSLNELHPEMPPALAEVVYRATRKESAERPDARTLAAELEQAVAEVPEDLVLFSTDDETVDLDAPTILTQTRPAAPAADADEPRLLARLWNKLRKSSDS